MFPSLFQLIKSRLFIERVLKKVFSNQYNKELTLLAILTHGDQPTVIASKNYYWAQSQILIKWLVSVLTLWVYLAQLPTDPILSKDLADET